MDVEGWLTSELASYACGACGQPYGESHVRLIARREELYFVDLSCLHCGSQAVAIVTIQLESEPLPEGIELVAMSSGDDEGPSLPPVSVDDVLDIHGLLAGFHGDVHELMAHLDRPGPRR